MKAKGILLLVALLAACAATPRWLTEEQMAAVKPGMSRAEVERVLGGPPDGGTERRSGEEIAAWRMRSDDAPYDAVYFQVHYRVGIVTRTTRALLYEAKP